MTPTAPILSAHPSDVERARALWKELFGPDVLDGYDDFISKTAIQFATVRTETLEEAARVADRSAATSATCAAFGRVSEDRHFFKGRQAEAVEIAQAIRSKITSQGEKA